MNQADVGGVTLAYEVSGTGEPVVLIHGALIAETFRPLLVEPSLAGRYQLITYRRQGYAGTGTWPRPMVLKSRDRSQPVILSASP